MPADLLVRRMGTFAELAKKSRNPFGRTALMKVCYFLQESKDVPLQYSFSLYTYGPFDSEVLADLQTAEELNILATEFEQYPGGYGYQISPGSLADRVVKQAKEFLDDYGGVVGWAAESIASKRPSELELASTIVFVSKQEPDASDDALTALVRAVKPNFSVSDVQNQLVWLRKNELLAE